MKDEMKRTTEPAYAVADPDRLRRCGVGEVIYGAGKTAEQICGILRMLRENGQENILVSRLDVEKEAQVRRMLSETEAASWAYHAVPKTAVFGGTLPVSGHGTIAVVTAGTSDIPVAEEAAVTAEFLGNAVQRIYDVGVAGLDRLLARKADLQAASVIIVIAGMEGALASVVGGLVSAPVIAVPTSVGYGANFEGLSALLSMLNSCASGVSVVNIDNGFGAGYQASAINHVGLKRPE